MNLPRDKAKRWQFGTRDLFLVVMLVSTPIALYRIALFLSFIPVAGITLGLISVCMVGGAFGALLGWALTGLRRGFVAGYCVGALVAPAILLVILEHVRIE